MVEWTKALVLKTSEAQASVGSNPTPSAETRTQGSSIGFFHTGSPQNESETPCGH